MVENLGCNCNRPGLRNVNCGFDGSLREKNVNEKWQMLELRFKRVKQIFSSGYSRNESCLNEPLSIDAKPGKMAESGKLLWNSIGLESAGNFLDSLKKFGESSMPVFKDKVRYEMKQFVAAAIVSEEEFEKEDTKIIREAESKFKEAIKTQDFSDIYKNYSLSFNRLVVLVNTPRPKRHGEARLLDPFGDIRKGILKYPFDGSFINDNDINFLEKLKEMFLHEFGHNRYLIVIFSHFIPCTEPIHQCAQIVNKFAEQQNTKVIVSYENVYDLTDKAEAMEIMNRNEKIKFQRPTTLPNCSSSYLEPYYVEEEPRSSRMSRRDKIEKMRPDPYRPERKKRKSFSRQNSYDYRI